MKITAFCCHNSLYGVGGAAKMAKAEVPGIHKVEIPCSGRLEPIYILKEFENGADGVVVVACPAKMCQLIHGSARMEKRIEYAKKLISDAGMEPERLMMFRPEPPTAPRLAEIIEEASAGFAALGASPLKAAV